MSHPHINTTTTTLGNGDDPQPISIRRDKSNTSVHHLDPHHSQHQQHHSSPIPTPSSHGSTKNLMEDEDDDQYWGKPIKNSQDEEVANQPMNKGEASYVGSNTSYSSSAFTNPQSPLLAFRNSIFEFIVSFKRNESFIKSKYQAVAWIMLHIYMIYYSLITCSITTTASEESSGAICKEIEANSENYANVSYEVKKLLERLDKKQSQILALHQEFFKELSSENPSEDKLEKINRKSNNLIIFCENAYKNCMYTNMNNKTLLRAYAYFLEIFRFEIEVANELYEEANQIEEEKSKTNKQSHSKSNRVVPYTSASEESSLMKRRKSDTLKHGVSFDEVVDNWDSISARMEESMKQEAFYRNSINTPEHRKSYYFTFLPFVIVSFLVLLILLTMSLVFSSEFTSRTVLEEKICSIAGAPSIMANHIRSIQARSKEIEVQSQDGDALSFELQKILEKLEKRQAKIINLHQDFFKELSSENPSETKLEDINRQAHNLTHYCENAYKNSMSSNMNNKTLMRAYAHFLETFKFELEMAAELYEEANQIEEEKAKSTKKKQPENRVLPYATSTSQLMKHSKSNAAMKNAVSFDEVVDNWDSISARMEETMREEAFYRNSINMPERRKSFFMLFLPFIVISILIILFMLILSLIVSSEFTSRTALEEKICSIAGAPSIMANHVRTLQARYRYLNETTAGPVQHLATLQANYVLNLVKNVMSASTESFFPSITDDFISQKWTYKIPNKQVVGESSQVYTTMNVSVLDFIAMFAAQAPTVISQFSYPVQLNNTATNFPVLFFLYNRETMTDAFDGFCQYFLTFSMERADTLSQVFLWSSGILLGCYFVLVGFYISMLSQYFVQIRQVIFHIFRKIQKDEVGKLYHTLTSTKTGDYGETVLSPKNKIIIYTAITFFVVALVSPIQIYEFQLNKQNQFITMKTAASVNYVLSSVTSVNFKLAEMIIASNMSDYTPDELHLRNQKQLMNITMSWSYAVRGAPELGYSNSLFGKYSDIDKLLAYKCDSNTSMVNYTSGPALDILPDSLVKTRVSCYGLEKLIHSFQDLAAEINEDLKARFYTKSYETDQYFTYLYYPALVAVQLIYDFTSTYVQNTKQSEDYLAIISTILGSLAVLVFGWLSYLAMMDLFREIQSLRIMLNYIPKDVVDMIPDMIDYILNYRVPSSAQKLKKLIKRRNAVMSGLEVDDENMDMTRSILNSGVDGSIICNPKGEVVMFNPSSEDMFGYKKEEILGIRLETLFTELNVEKITVLIDSMKVCNEETGVSADSFEVTGLRKNKTTFPAFVSISISQYLGKPILSCFVKDVTQLKKHSLLLGEEKKKSEELLLNILPLPVANRLKQGETYIAEKFPDVTIFFSDMVGFTKMSSGMEADQLVMMLNTIVNEFDKLTEKYLIDKIKTIGDAYFAVSGTHSSKSSDHPERMLKFAISVYSFLRDFNIKFGKEVNLRIGMHTGPCVGGVIGTKKFAYDLWGDTINTASRMESTGVPGRIQISRATYERVFDLGYEFEERESIYVKGKGEMKTYLLKDKHHANPLPTVQEIQELKIDSQSPTNLLESSSVDELTVLKLNQTSNTQQNLPETTNNLNPSPTISPSKTEA
ncbi:predicted protein [Naegleria gruberi]|uniref:Predicted protein n=1 Tax=Naegleria gruberi TaxID=5762 RepID=D2W3A5_NAEGR|nr:uncharacterized protein NAEGRDRAFT_54380 [Naegleria gruberi]EFC36483.1 predicted protein [Naegleria gruberi]|eukprot:XP_002669227.1 predicted protein [Naegleria gruberi strain NEG-M]